jgi:hypothetical protein
MRVAFAHIAIIFFVRQLLHHDRKYINYIDDEQNIRHLLIFVSVVFRWVFSELSNGVFKDQDFTMNASMKAFKEDITTQYDEMPVPQRDALLRSIFTTQKGEQPALL